MLFAVVGKNANETKIKTVKLWAVKPKQLAGRHANAFIVYYNAL